MTTPVSVRWEELLPREFVARLQERPLVYLPMGLCEPHGHPAAFGLDTLKAVWLCEESASRWGGIVAPTQGYHIHETGYHASWLREVVGEVNPHLAGVPPHVLLEMLVYQLRAFVNAGFTQIAVVTGHHGNQSDLRLAAREVMRARPVQIIVVSDPELARPTFLGDHAGAYEVSQLMYIRPDLVDLNRIEDIGTSPLGRFAQGEDAAKASAQHGREILEASLSELDRRLRGIRPTAESIDPISLDEAEDIWQRVNGSRSSWCTLSEANPDLLPPDF